MCLDVNDSVYCVTESFEHYKVCITLVFEDTHTHTHRFQSRLKLTGPVEGSMSGKMEVRVVMVASEVFTSPNAL